VSRRVCARMRGGGGVGHFERKRARAVLISLARSLDRSLARARTRSLSRILYSLSLSVSLYLSIYLSCLSLHSLSLSLAAICWATSAQRRCHPKEALY